MNCDLQIFPIKSLNRERRQRRYGAVQNDDLGCISEERQLPQRVLLRGGGDGAEDPQAQSQVRLWEVTC